MAEIVQPAAVGGEGEGTVSAHCHRVRAVHLHGGHFAGSGEDGRGQLAGRFKALGQQGAAGVLLAEHAHAHAGGHVVVE